MSIQLGTQRVDGQVITNLLGKRKLSEGERHQEEAESNSLVRPERPKGPGC